MQLYDNDQRVTIHCKATNGDGNCGKRQCRGDDRKNFVAALKYESVESYRIKQADKMMIEGDSHEPPHLYTSKVMRNAKYEARMQEYRDPNPITAICKFKRTQEGREVIRDISLDPVVVYFWSNHQIRVYNRARTSPNACLCIDATGNVSKHMFLYYGV